MTTLRTTFRLLTILGVTGLTFGCAGAEKEETTDQADDKSVMEVTISGEAETEEYDLNGDGTADMTSVFTRLGDATMPREQRARVLARKEIDVNFDTKTDVKQFYSPDGSLVREEMDLDFDSKIDAIDFYVDGSRVRREMYLNFVEKPSMWKYYEEGKLVRKSKDTTGDGLANEFEYYGPDGKIVRIGYDTKGDGKPDYYEDADSP
jgi:hypothetical protein